MKKDRASRRLSTPRDRGDCGFWYEEGRFAVSFVIMLRLKAAASAYPGQQLLFERLKGWILLLVGRGYLLPRDLFLVYSSEASLNKNGELEAFGYSYLSRRLCLGSVSAYPFS